MRYFKGMLQKNNNKGSGGVLSQGLFVCCLLLLVVVMFVMSFLIDFLIIRYTSQWRPPQYTSRYKIPSLQG